MSDKPYIQARAMNWRVALAVNQRKTVLVMCSFVLIYLAIGFLVDLYIYDAFYQNNFMSVFHALITLQIFPVITFASGVVALIAIGITFALHDRIMLLGTTYHPVTESGASDLAEQQLYNLVEELKIAAGLRYMPKIYIIEADYLNAFASGYSEKSAMIAVTRGLMQKLTREELQAVMAHELSHIRHGDIKLTLMVSVLSNLMLMMVDILFYNTLFSRRDRDENGWILIVIVLLRYVLPLITILLMLYLSRTREYMADAGSVELMRDNQPLGKALLKIANDHDQNYEQYQRAYGKTTHENVRQAAYIFDPFDNDIHPIKSTMSFFSTHPAIRDRLDAIGFDK